MKGLIVWLYCVFCIIEFCSSSAVIEVRLVRFNSSGLLSSKTCCDTNSKAPCPANQCDPQFFVCLQDFSGMACPLGNITTGYITDTDSVTFTDVIGDIRTRNPIIFPVSDYPGGVIARVTVYDEDVHEGGTINDKLDYLQYVYTFEPDKNGTHHDGKLIPLRGVTSALDIEISVHCDGGYYGNKCNVKCLPDELHYCDTEGKKLCRPSKDCTSTVSRPPTSPHITSQTKQLMAGTDGPELSSTTPTFLATSQYTTETSSVSSLTFQRTTTVSNSNPSNSPKIAGSVLSKPVTSPQTTTTQSTHVAFGNTSIAKTALPDTSTIENTRYITAPAKVQDSTMNGKETFINSIGGCVYNVSVCNNDDNRGQLVLSFINEYVINELAISEDDVQTRVVKIQFEDKTRYLNVVLLNQTEEISLNTSLIVRLLEDFCSQDKFRSSSFQVGKGDDSDVVKVVLPTVIGGLVSLLLILTVYFLCRRKCKRRQIVDSEKTTDIQTVTKGKQNS